MSVLNIGEQRDAWEFLLWLDESDIEVTDWEAKFIHDNLERLGDDDPHDLKHVFSGAQMSAIHRMRDSYGKLS